MKNNVALLALAAASALAAFVAVPAAAETVRTSVAHEGRTILVSYEPRSQTSHKQTGLGPRSSPGCLWTTRVAVERSVTDDAGRPIAALTRTVGEEKTRKGMHVGHCRDSSPRRTDAFAGNQAKLRAFVAAAADRDAQGLRTELASLDHLRVANAR